MYTTSFNDTFHGTTHTMGGWMPESKKDLGNWVAKTYLTATENKADRYLPVVADFQKLIESDPVVNMYFNSMFNEVPIGEDGGPESGDEMISDYHQMLDVINYVLTTAPEYNTTGMVGFPINAILVYVMWTPSGFSAFLNDKVNAAFRAILTEYCKFLCSAESLYVLNPSNSGWMCRDAIEKMNIEEYQHDPHAPFWGFTSFNDFFIRTFKEGMRPVASPDDAKIIVSACEATPFALAVDVKARDTFWLKGQPYSLEQMLAGNYVSNFAGTPETGGGTVYQAYLSAANYHRWHAPVGGIIKHTQVVDGSYYAEAYSVGFDPEGPNNSQGFLAHVATRALIFIQSDAAGLVCFIAVGMSEVSSCIITVQKDQRVKKGEQLGYFQFGGSTHCLVFEPGVIKSFDFQAIPNVVNPGNEHLVKVNSQIAVAN